MPVAAPSMLSLSAAGLYSLVCLACLAAAAMASRHRQTPVHWRAWSVIAVGFAALAALRISGAEELVRGTLREVLKFEGAYDERQTIQRPLAAAVLCIVSVLAGLGLMRHWRAARGRRNFAIAVAWTGLAGMVLLLGLRIVSLHQLDKILYGPAKVNWIIDIGATGAVLGAALLYMRYVTRRP